LVWEELGQPSPPSADKPGVELADERYVQQDAKRK
jgi:hypothetical protein